MSSIPTASTPQTVLLSLGSNLGDRAAHIDYAIKRLKAENGINLLGVSSVIETEPVGPSQPNYLNAAVLAETVLPPATLLMLCRDIEDGAGREREIRWGPRALDIDIVLYGSLILDTPGLKIPHPEFRNRLFVLVPAVQVAPHLIDPVTEKSLKCLLEELKTRHGMI